MRKFYYFNEIFFMHSIQHLDTHLHYMTKEYTSSQFQTKTFRDNVTTALHTIHANDEIIFIDETNIDTINDRIKQNTHMIIVHPEYEIYYLKDVNIATKKIRDRILLINDNPNVGLLIGGYFKNSVFRPKGSSIWEEIGETPKMLRSKSQII